MQLWARLRFCLKNKLKKRNLTRLKSKLSPSSTLAFQPILIRQKKEQSQPKRYASSVLITLTKQGSLWLRTRRVTKNIQEINCKKSLTTTASN